METFQVICIHSLLKEKLKDKCFSSLKDFLQKNDLFFLFSLPIQEEVLTSASLL